MDKLLMHLPLALENVQAMDGTTGGDLEQAALTALVSVLDCLDDYSPFAVLASLVASVTYAQPDRQQALNWLLGGVAAGWKTAAAYDVALAMKEKQSAIVQ